MSLQNYVIEFAVLSPVFLADGALENYVIETYHGSGHPSYASHSSSSIVGLGAQVGKGAEGAWSLS